MSRSRKQSRQVDRKQVAEGLRRFARGTQQALAATRKRKLSTGSLIFVVVVGGVLYAVGDGDIAGTVIEFLSVFLV